QTCALPIYVGVRFFPQSPFGGLVETFHDAAQCPRVGFGQELSVLFVQYVRFRETLVHPVVDHACRGIEAEQVVHGGSHFERTLVAVLTHCRHPTWIDHSRPEHPSGFLVECAGADRVRGGAVADVGGRGGARQGANSGDHPAVVLEVVVRVRDVVFASVGVLRCDGDPTVGILHVLASGNPVEVPAVGEPTPYRVHLGEVGVVVPVPGVHQLQQARAVGTGFGPENPSGGAALIAVLGSFGVCVCTDEVLLVGFVETRRQLDGVIDQVDDMRERIPEETGDPYGDVDAWPAELRQIDRLDPGHTAGGLVPHGFYSQWCQHLGSIVTGGTHRGCAPHRQSAGSRRLAGTPPGALQPGA